MDDNKLFSELYSRIEKLPVIDCHEHIMGPKEELSIREPIASLINGYIQSDLLSAGISPQELDILNDNSIDTEKKWGIFKRFWEQIQFTAYAKVTKLIVRDIYGEEKISLEALNRIREKIIQPTKENYDALLDKANIKLLLSDILWDLDTLKKFIEGRFPYYDRIKFLFSLPQFHNNIRNFEFIQRVGALLNRHITSLDDYLEVVYELLKRAKEKGVVGIKDQSAYSRSLDYRLVTRYEAETLFNKILSDPRNSLGWPEAKPLDDYLFHQFMNFARELKLPVQIHTGHMAGIRNRIEKTNAVLLSSILELYQDVNFDLFHGNWPYIGEILFLGKNYPNVYMDFCWVNIIDPMYSEELYCRAILTLPYTKVNGFGGDYFDVPEYIVSHLKIAKENMTRALVNLIKMGWINEDSAINIAKSWLFENPKRLFNLDA
ncbi:MAG: amidohydrolase [bacterium]|nr:amidohydrolase [bacterium]